MKKLMKLSLGLGLMLISFTTTAQMQETQATVESISTNGRSGSLRIASSGKTANFIVVGEQSRRLELGGIITVIIPTGIIRQDPNGCKVTLTVIWGGTGPVYSNAGGYYTVVNFSDGCVL